MHHVCLRDSYVLPLHVTVLKEFIKDEIVLVVLYMCWDWKASSANQMIHYHQNHIWVFFCWDHLFSWGSWYHTQLCVCVWSQLLLLETLTVWLNNSNILRSLGRSKFLGWLWIIPLHANFSELSITMHLSNISLQRKHYDLELLLAANYRSKT